MNGIYDPNLVVLSVLVSTFASYTALDLARSVAATGGNARAGWVAGGSLSMGVGIWSMHFIGMLALTLPWTSIAYDIPLLTVSILVAIVASAIALALVSRQPVRLPVLIAGGVALAAAISGMHYIGMAAMRMEGAIEWNWVLVAISILIALVASFVALQLAFRMRRAEGRGARHIAGAIAMGLAISGMHYTGMAAARFTPSVGGMAVRQEDVLATDGLAVAVIGTTALILITALVGSIITRELARRTALAEENARLYRMARKEVEERQEVEKKVRAQSAAMEAAVDGISIMAAPGTYTYVNAGYAEMYGYPDPSELIGRSWTVLYDEDERRRLEAAAFPAVDRDGFWRGEAVGLRADGSTFPQDVALTALEDGGLIWITRDITERKEAEREEKAQQRKLSASYRLSAVGELAAGVAHEVNNPLQAISGFVELLLENERMPEEVKEDLALIGSEAKRAGTIVRNLLAFARQETLEKHAVDATELVRSVLNLKEPQLRLANVEIQFDPEPDIPLAWADSHQIQQVLHNLIANARQAIQHAYPQGRIRIILRSSGDMVELIVEDTGPGLPAEVLERMFTPFFTTKGTREGTGLGLSIAHGIVAEHGGEMWAENWGRPAIEEGAAGEGGARLVVRLPVVPTRVHSTTTTDREEAPAKPDLSRRLLIVEDEPAVAAVLERFLTRWGHEVEICLNAERAIEVLQDGESFDVIFSDLRMPGVGGQGLYRWLQKTRPDLISSVVFTSGDVVTPETHTFLSETGRPVLSKPYELSDLRAELEKLFENQ